MSKVSPRKFSTEFKVRVLARLQRGEPVAAVAREAGIARQVLDDWGKAFRAHGPAGLNRKRGRKPGWRPPPRLPETNAPASADAGSSASGSTDELARAQARIAELERVIGRQQADLHFFREALRLWDATSRSGGAPTSTRSSKK
jgi:transposase-like protein